MQILNNLLLVTPDDYGIVKLPGGIVLNIDGSYEVEKHSPQSGKVLATCSRLNFAERGFCELDFETDLEIAPGDHVILNYKAIKNSLDHGYWCSEGVFVRYSDVYMGIRNDQPFAVNGYVIAEPLTAESLQAANGLLLPQSSDKPLNVAVVKYVAAPIRKYKFDLNYGADFDLPQVGDKIIYHKVDSIELQYADHRSIETDRTLYRIQHKDVMAKIDLQGNLIPLGNKVLIKQDPPAPRLLYAHEKPVPHLIGTIIGVGKGYLRPPSLTPTPLLPTVGSRVYFEFLYAAPVIHKGQEYHLALEENISFFTPTQGSPPEWAAQYQFTRTPNLAAHE